MADNTDTPSRQPELHADAPAEPTVAQLQEWLRVWVSQATGQPIEAITVDRPMEEFGLGSRDAIALAGDIEEHTGVMLTATVAYQHPTIASLARRIVEGEPQAPAIDVDDAYYLDNAHDSGRDIAIVGLATRLPGAGTTPESTWEFLIARGDAIGDLPPGRWAEFTADPAIAEAVREANTRGGYLDSDTIKGFDAEFFAMSPLEVERVDPQQRIMLELAWEAFEHARIPVSELKGRRVGVFVGTSTNDFQMVAAAGLTELAAVRASEATVAQSANAYALTGGSSSIIANRISYFYDFRGPSQAVDTACSSTLVAVHDAVAALRTGECEVALAGGVNMLLAPAITLGFDSVGAIAGDGRIKAFSADADGMVRSEGGGFIVLKRLIDAERDNNAILAVVKGSAVNSDGRSNGLLAPNPDAQADVLRQAYRDAGILPRTVDYVEAHGTGTLLGDPIEADALGRVIGRGRDEDKPALLGSAKTNFGHLESAAGVASVTKAVMALRHNVLPPSLNYSAPNPYIPFDSARLRVVDSPTEFPRYSGVATVGVSGFGFGGTNAHLVVQEYVPAVDAGDGSTQARPVSTPSLSTGLVVLAVSAYLPSRRRRAAAELAQWLDSIPGRATPLIDVGRALARRSYGRSRAVVLAAGHDEAITGLEAIAAGRTHPGVFVSDAPAAKGAMWVLSGFGAQHRKMAKQLYRENAVFAAAIDEVDELIADEAGYAITEMFLDDAQTYDVATSQVGIFAIQVGLAALLRYHGADADAVVGHSLGEVAGAYISGGLDLVDAVRVICTRARLMGEGEAMLTGDDIRLMGVVEYGVEEIDAVLGNFPDLEIAVYASPTHTVVGGPADQVNAVVAQAEEQGKTGRVLATKGAGHTSQTDALLGELAAELAGIEARRLTHDVFSTVHALGRFPPGSQPIHDVDYWVKNMRRAVWFAQAVRLGVDAGYTTFVELNANPVALVPVAATTFSAGLHDARLIPTLKRKEDESQAIVGVLAQLWASGHSVDLPSLFGVGDYADIPRTSFVRKPYWPEVRIAGVGGPLGARVGLPDGRYAWELPAGSAPDLGELSAMAGRQVLGQVRPGAGMTYPPISTDGILTVTLTPHPGGASVQIHARSRSDPGSGFRLVHEAVMSTGEAVVAPAVDAGEASETAVQASPPGSNELHRRSRPVQAASPDATGDRWDPAGPISAEDRLAEIIAESMGYAVEDLPREIPLIELGLDSLMAVRIKNRVEYEFAIPPLQLQAVAGATLTDVAKYLEYAIDHRDEVQQLYEQQQAEKADAGRQDAPVPAAVQAAGAGAEPTADAGSADVPPRDPAERLVFATWAMATGRSAGGIHNPLPGLSDEQARALAERLSERCEGEIGIDDVRGSANIEELATVVRAHLEGGSVDGFVRTLRKPGNSTTTPVFLFHPTGSTTMAYGPLLARLPEDVGVYGFERVDGALEDRARQYLPKLREIAPEGPYVLVGWSLGGALALLVARELRAAGADVRLVGLIDTVLSADPPEPDTLDNRKKRVLRYQSFARKTYNIDAELDDEQITELATADDDEQIRIVLSLIEFSGMQLPGGMLEHQRTSWIDNQALFKADPTEYHYDGNVVLYLGDRYHDGAIELEPRMAHRAPNGGWDEAIDRLEIVYVGGDHVQIVDEPYIATIGADLTARITGKRDGGSE